MSKYFNFTAKLLQKTAYGYDISGEVTGEGSEAIANRENQTNINDTAQPQDKHQTPRNPANMAQDTDAEKEFPELEGISVQKRFPSRQK